MGKTRRGVRTGDGPYKDSREKRSGGQGRRKRAGVVCPKLKLFVWESICCGYECGLAVALAYNVEQAKDFIMEERSVKGCEAYRKALDEEDPAILDLDTPLGVCVVGGDG